MNASERRNARKLARRRTRQLVAVRRAVAIAEGGRAAAVGAEYAAIDVPPQRTAE